MKRALVVSKIEFSSLDYDAFSILRSEGILVSHLGNGSFTPQREFLEETYECDLTSISSTLSFVRSLPLKFDAVTQSCDEPLTPLVSVIAKQLNLIGNTPEVALRCRNKFLMRRAMNEAGLPFVKSFLCKNFQEIKSALTELKGTGVAKPLGAHSSFGVFLVTPDLEWGQIEERYYSSIEFLKNRAVPGKDIFGFSKEDRKLLEMTDEQFDFAADYVVEEYLPGPEISVDSITQNGAVSPLGIALSVRMPPPYFVQTREEMPFRGSLETLRSIEVLNEGAIRAMEIKNSPSHFELILTEEGPKPLEIGCRMGADDILDAVYQTSGYNLMYEAVMTSLGEKRDYLREIKAHFAMEYILPKKTGVFSGIVIPSEVSDHPAITEVMIAADPGTHVAPPPAYYDYLGYVSAKGETPEEARKILEWALSKIEVRYQ